MKLVAITTKYIVAGAALLMSVSCSAQEYGFTAEGKIISECMMRGEIVSGIVQRHGLYRPKSETIEALKGVLGQPTYGIYKLVLDKEAVERWSLFAVEKIYASPRSQVNASEMQTVFSDECTRNPDIYLQQSLVNWAETNRFHSKAN